ncbi:hypothetical protein [Aquimarina algiphila]|uniref:hypothetical protein n=1 Tax=Aquimarina algiphila TaxID=2047982 RepID=UPI002492C54A|nr:hypothetical protein [Aquimarina algiphila]
MKKVQFVKNENNSKPLYFVYFIYYKIGGAEKMEAFKNEMSSAMEKYGVENLFSITVDKKEAIVGANTFEKPDEILIQKVKNVNNFNTYIEDIQFTQSKPLLQDAVRKMTYIVGTQIERREMSSEVEFDKRMYALGLIYYKPDGREKLMEFNKKAIPLFMKHSFYADKFLDVLDKGSIVGKADDFVLPDELRIFWADSVEDLYNYNNDTDYQAIKGIREEGVADYPTFLGKYKPYANSL